MGERIEDLVEGKVRKHYFCATALPPPLPHSPRLFVDEHLLEWKPESRLWSYAKSYLPPDRTMFVDLETAGLTGANITWLVGISYVENGRLRLEQLIARDPLEEKAVMDAFAERCKERPNWVSFNGSSFDGPRVKQRYRAFIELDKRRILPNGGKHIDVYQLCAKIARVRQMPSKNLGYWERLLFPKHQRSEDIPGAEIPEAYYDYVNRNRSPAKIIKAIAHNAEDLTTLPAIYLKALALGL